MSYLVDRPLRLATTADEDFDFLTGSSLLRESTLVSRDSILGMTRRGLAFVGLVKDDAAAAAVVVVEVVVEIFSGGMRGATVGDPNAGSGRLAA